MANSSARGPMSDSPEDIYRWAVAHDVEVDVWWHQQWKDNTEGMIECRASTAAAKEHFIRIEKRLGAMENSMANMKGRVTVWAALGSFAGGVVVAICAVVASYLLR